MYRKIDWKVESSIPFLLLHTVCHFHLRSVWYFLLLTCYCELLQPVVYIQVLCLVHSVGLDKGMSCVCDYFPLHNSFTACAPPVSHPLPHPWWPLIFWSSPKFCLSQKVLELESQDAAEIVLVCRGNPVFPTVALSHFLYFHTKHFTSSHQAHGGFSPRQAILCDTSWASYNLTQFWPSTQRQSQTPQFQDSVPQDCRPHT